MNLSLTLQAVARHQPGLPAISADSGRLSYGGFEQQVAAIAGGLRRRHGLAPGARVALVMENCLEFLPAMFGCWRAGLAAVPINSKLHPKEIHWIVGNAKAALIIATPDLADKLTALGEALPTLIATGTNDWRALLVAEPIVEAPTEPGDEAWLFYTSGTTGRPKGAVHVHGGFLAKIAEEVRIQADTREGDRVMWFTDMGWIMGPWVTVGTHAAGQTMVCLDGAPDFPTPGRLWETAARHRLTFLGISPTLVRALQPHGAEHARSQDLSALRAFGSTGEPWNDEPYRWLFREVGGGTRPILNISGGTEVGACLLACDITLPIASCSLGRPALGMQMDVVDQDGASLVGEVGELRGAHEGEIGGVEDEDRPLAGFLEVGERDLAEVALGRLVGFHGEVGHESADGDGRSSWFHVDAMVLGLNRRLQKRRGRDL